MIELKDQNQEKIFYLEEEMRLVKTELDFLKNIQREYFTSILSRGDDIRGKGIVWVIEAMWDIGLKVYRSMLPQDIDEKSKDFIIELAKLDYDVSKTKKDYQFFKSSIKNLLELAGKTTT
mmetsp:Transcript_2199/g.2144  ORF Transcript_2199/g.2144 Transcript_2199/m.2144 type:complete len:120 (+) Transcript_2199:1180-1539(+)